VAVVVAAALMVVAGLEVRVVRSSPVAGEQSVPITAPVHVAFSQAMDEPCTEAHFDIEPETSGRFEWDGQDLAFWPHGALAPDTAYTVTIKAGAASQRGRELEHDTRWQFRTRAAHLLYLGRPGDSAELRQLYLAVATGDSEVDSQPQQLTDHAEGVWDYAVHPEGAEIVYSVLREDGGSDLWRMERDGTNQKPFLLCPEDACLNPVWSPDGGILAFERRPIWADGPNLDPKAGRIWLLDLAKRRERPLFDYDVPLHSPAWAPSGQRLAYVSPMLPGLEFVDLDSEDLQQFGNEWGAAPVWSPDSQSLIVPELMLADESLVVRLVRIDLAEESLLDISGDDDLVKDVGPAWSPGGGWIAFGRQFLDEDRWTPGRQIWLTRPDGSEAYSLRTEPMGDHFSLAWRPDGAALAYSRSDLSEGPQPVPDVSVWVYDLAKREPRLVARDAVLPKWLP
jgi:Tol biopolymer transport system component